MNAKQQERRERTKARQLDLMRAKVGDYNGNDPRVVWDAEACYWLTMVKRNGKREVWRDSTIYRVQEFIGFI